MNGLGRTAILTMVSLLFLVTQVHAYTISFGGLDATQNGVDAGLTSGRGGIDATTNTAIGTDWFIETFDKTDGTGGFTTLDEGQLITTGGYDFRINTLPGVAAAPANDETYFAFTPEEDGGTPASVYVPNTAFYAFEEGLFIDYMGLYFGSIDTYNSLVFYLLGGGSFTIEGAQILNQFNGVSGNQYSEASNVYVNLDFNLLGGEVFSAFELRTNNVALELDNIVAHVTTVPTPEPSTFILLGAGLLGLGALGRKRFAQ
jgi:hypothetical protein